MAFEEIRNYFSRHVLGRIKAHGTGALGLAAPRVSAPRRSVETYPFRPKMQIHSPALLSFQGGLHCSSGGFRFSKGRAEVKGGKPRLYAPGEVTTRALPLALALRAKDGLRTALALPQERSNRLKWQVHPPKAPDEMLLAWYGPIVEGAVAKFSLNRQKGTLLIWYNPQSRQFKAAGIYLFRRASAGAKPEWRWV